LIVEAARDSDWQRRQAERNLREVEQYACAILEQRRTRFWQRFAAHALTSIC
jgi:hypothetical protein